MITTGKYTIFVRTAVIAAVVQLCAPSLAAEEKSRDWGVSASGGFSHVFGTFPTADQFFAGPTNYPQATLQMAYSTKPTNSGKFAEAYNWPTVGFGVTWSGLHTIPYQENAFLKDMVSVYGFFERDFYKTTGFSVGYDLKFGLGFNASKFDPVNNPNNIIFGSSATFCIGGGLYVKWRPVPNVELALKGNLRHHSVGRLAFPNFGLNEAGAEVSVRYYASAPQAKQTTHTMKDEFERKISYNIQAGGGIHHCNTEWEAFHDAPEDPDQKVNNMPAWPKFFASFNATYRYALKFSSGIGFDTFLTTREYMDRLRECDIILHGEEAVKNCGGYNPFSMGISLIQNFHYGNFSITCAVGVYLFKHYGIQEQLSWSFQRIGLRYDFPALGGMFLSMTCKSHYFTRAEMLEFGVGVKI